MAKLQVDSIVNKDDTGAVDFPRGATVTGVVTATSLTSTGDIIAGGLRGTPDIVVGVMTATSVSVSSSITVGSGFIENRSVGLGQTDTTGRDAGVGTATGTLIYNETTVQVEVYDGTQWVGGLTTPFSATGGTKDTTSRSGYAVHTFTGDGSFVASGAPIVCEYLVIGGGGAGGSDDRGAGGGAGALRFSDSFTVNPGTYTIQVGGGGAETGPPSNGNDGTPSFITNPGITSITSAGGGGGGFPNNPGSPGGCGGGGGGNSPIGGGTIDGGTGTGDSGGTGDSSSPANGWGNDGGTSSGFNPPANLHFGSGGGGAGTAGSNGGGTGGTGGGGSGLAYSIDGSPTTRAGGGGGGTWTGPTSGGAAGPGGGGQGGVGPSGPRESTAGTANTGGGGGAGGPDYNGSAGGSGIVIIAYPTS